MDMSIHLADQCYRVKLDSPISLAIPLDFNGPQPSFFGAPKATATPLRVGDFVGDTRQKGSCNVAELRLIPHCNGTHTESVGHIVHQGIPITEPNNPMTASLLRAYCKPRSGVDRVMRSRRWWCAPCPTMTPRKPDAMRPCIP